MKQGAERICLKIISLNLTMKRISEGTKLKNKGTKKTECCKLMPPIRHIDPDILKRTQSVLVSSPYEELEKRFCLCLQIERNNWQAKLKAVLKQLDKEHKKCKKIKDSVLEILLNIYSSRQESMTFSSEELTTRQLLNHLLELIKELRDLNLKLMKDNNLGPWQDINQGSEHGTEKLKCFKVNKDIFCDKERLTLPNLNTKYRKPQQNCVNENVKLGHKQEKQSLKFPNKSESWFRMDATQQSKKSHVINRLKDLQE